MANITDKINNFLRTETPDIVVAITILIVGWIAALIISAIVKKLLRRTNLDNKLVKWMANDDPAKGLKAERWISKAVYYILLLFVLGLFFRTLGIPQISEPIDRFTSDIFAYAPKILGAGLILLIAWIIGTILKMVVTKFLTAFNLDEKVNTNLEKVDASNVAEAQVEGVKQVGITNMLGNVAYWLPFLFLLPAFLDVLDLNGLLTPVSGMINKILAFLPNLAGAALLLVVGWFVVKIVKNIIENVLASFGVDAFSEKYGISKIFGNTRLSQLLGNVVGFLIFIPILVAALNALNFEALTVPASNFLNRLLAATPNIFAAILLGFIGVVIGRLLGGIVTNFLAGIGFDRMISSLGLTNLQATGEGQKQGSATPGTKTPSQIAGTLVMIGVLFFVATEAFRQLGFLNLSAFTTRFVALAGNVLIGLLIFAAGLYLANIAKKAIMASGIMEANLLSTVAKILIIVLASAMALSRMGLAPEIVNLAFGLTLGAIAVAFALAFGLGGRDVAGRVLSDTVDKFKSKTNTPTQA